MRSIVRFASHIIFCALCFATAGLIGAEFAVAQNQPPPVRVFMYETRVGSITLGTGWNTWDFWWGKHVPRFRQEWNNEQWESYLGLLKEAGGDWLRVDLYYGDTEPRNDNDDPEVINWAAFTFDSPKLKTLYRLLDYCQANGIDVYLTYSYLRSNHDYNADRLTGWMSKEAVSNGYPELWTRPKDEPVDKRELAENLAATTYYLLKTRNYRCIKQVSLYVEPDVQWTNVDGFEDTVFLGKLLNKLGIRGEIDILAPHTMTYMAPQPGDYDVFAIENYEVTVDWSAPQEGLQNLKPVYKKLARQFKSTKPSMEVALMEYGSMWNAGATDPLPSFLSALTDSCLVFELYNSGFAGTQRWAFEPVYHPYLGFGVIAVDGVQFPAAATDVTPDTTTPIVVAMMQGATFVKVPQTFEPQRLINTNLSRGTIVHRSEVQDPTPPGRGLCAIITRSQPGNWRIGLVNLYSSPRDIEVSFPDGSPPSSLHWEYYDATLPQHALQAQVQMLGENVARLQLPPRSLSFLHD